MRSNAFQICALLLGVLGASAIDQAQSSPMKVDALTSPAGPASSVPQMTEQSDPIVLSWVERSPGLRHRTIPLAFELSEFS